MGAGLTDDDAVPSTPTIGGVDGSPQSADDASMTAPASRPVEGDTQAGNGNDDSIVALFTRLIDDAERFVRAELRLYRASLFSRLADARVAIIMLLTSFLIAQSAIIALLVGLVVILRPSLGAVGATATVVGGGVVTAALLAWLAIEKIRKLTNIRDKTS